MGETLGEKLQGLPSAVWESVQSELAKHGIEITTVAGEPGVRSPRVKVVCTKPDLKESVEEMGKSQRDQVVMVRVDEETVRSLDAWTETGAVRSRSEAAALFIREGLSRRASELDQLRDALRGVEEAKDRLRSRVKEIFGEPSSTNP
jgi:hypothetical protein